MRRILEGIRVLDVTQLVAGPLCTRTLADLGADVIRIERPGSRNRAATGSSYNYGKRSIALDLNLLPGRWLSHWQHGAMSSSKTTSRE
jgi:crotonobetainyl-CoA:carnitine CoA-transferase CaiB-like acyl-CoA transferase